MSNNVPIWLFRSQGVGGFNLLKGAAGHLNAELKIVDINEGGYGTDTEMASTEILADIRAEVLRANHPVTRPMILVVGACAMKIALKVKSIADFDVVVVKFNRTHWKVRGVDLWVHTNQFLSFFWQRNAVMDLPFHDFTKRKFLDAKTSRDASSKRRLNRPCVVALIGGASRVFDWDRATAIEMMEQLKLRVTKAGGTLLVTTSRRTGVEIAHTIKSFEDSITKVHLWQAEIDENPFTNWIALADLIVVTEDSLSMLSETYSTGKPVEAFRLRPKQDFRTGEFGFLSAKKILGVGRISLVENWIKKGLISEFSGSKKISTPSGEHVFLAMTESQKTIVAKLKSLRTIKSLS